MSGERMVIKTWVSALYTFSLFNLHRNPSSFVFISQKSRMRLREIQYSFRETVPMFYGKDSEALLGNGDRQGDTVGFRKMP